MNDARIRQMTWPSKLILLALLAIAGWNCLDAPNFPETPFIEFLGNSKDTLRQGEFMEDSLMVLFRFEDGDGDIGRDDEELENNIFFIDERTGIIDYTYAIPAIPPEGAGNGVEGTVKIVLFTTCCIYPPGPNTPDPCKPNPIVPFDTVQYRIYIKDQAGHKSNEILTSPIILRCD